MERHELEPARDWRHVGPLGLDDEVYAANAALGTCFGPATGGILLA
ncbi:MAG: hypothetical protein HY303_19220 [Candidatus Wallbacteria bacterium]|nr:hypothetical protein [Candidatus Wallbacteria bacterium]